VLRPDAIASALDALPCDAKSWVCRHPVFRYCPLEQRTQRIEKVALSEWRAVLLIDDTLHMLTSEQHGAMTICIAAVNTFVAVRFRESSQVCFGVSAAFPQQAS